MHKSIGLFGFLLLTGCAALNDVMTPGLSVNHSDFDQATIITQPSVGANRPSLTTGDAWNELGFQWTSKSPDIVNIKAGLGGDIINVQSAEFIADDNPKISAQKIGGHTTIDLNTLYGGRSSGQFVMSLNDFKKIAAAQVVKFKVVTNGNENVSRFGRDYPDVIVQAKIQPFIDAIAAHSKK